MDNITELVSKKVSTWISRIPTHMKYMERATYFGDQSYYEVYGNSLTNYLSNGDNWELDFQDPAFHIDEFELGGKLHIPGDAGEVNWSRVQDLLWYSNEPYCSQYTFTPKNSVLCEHVRLEVFVYDNEVIGWTIVED